jgi:hypothetical protein
MSSSPYRAPSVSSGYFGLAHRDAVLAKEEKQLTDFIAAFKHSLLFSPKLVLADHMMFSRNFANAYRKDDGFRGLMRGDLIDVAYFEKFANGRAFTLVEHRQFVEYLRQKQDPRFDPRNPDCPLVPFDSDLRAMEANLGRLTPNASWRDPLFTEFASQEIENGTFRTLLGKFHGSYTTAFDRMREDLEAQKAPLGIVHFDEAHRPEGTENIFDYMARASSLSKVPRDRLVAQFGNEVAHAHRVLLIKAEMFLMPGVHAVLPSELRGYRTLALSDSASGTIDEREAQMRTLELDLSAISPETLASLTAAEVLELRKAAVDFFTVIEQESGRTESFGLIFNTLANYLRRLNSALAYKAVPHPPGRVNGIVKLAQGKIARHTRLLNDAIAMSFKVASTLTHTYYTHHVPVPGGDAALDKPFQELEALTQAAFTPGALERSLKDIPAHLALSPTGEQVMQYE